MLATLPRGIGVVRVKTPVGGRTLVSDRLTDREASVGRVIAAFLVRRRRFVAVVLKVSDIAAAADEMVL